MGAFQSDAIPDWAVYLFLAIVVAIPFIIGFLIYKASKKMLNKH